MVRKEKPVINFRLRKVNSLQNNDFDAIEEDEQAKESDVQLRFKNKG
jgi:hypothetical protein